MSEKYYSLVTPSSGGVRFGPAHLSPDCVYAQVRPDAAARGKLIELEPEMLTWEMFSELRTCKLCDGTFNREAQRRGLR